MARSYEEYGTLAEDQYGTSSFTKRHRYTDLKLMECQKASAEITDVLEDVTLNGLSISRACNKRGIDMLGFRRILTILETLHDDHVHCGAKKIESTLTMEETFYAKVYGLAPSDGIGKYIPFDGTDTIAFLLNSDMFLSEKERQVVTMRYIDGKTLQAIADGMNVTREYIRQLTEQAMRKLRKSKKCRDILSLGIRAYRIAESELDNERQEMINAYKSNMLALDSQIQSLRNEQAKMEEAIALHKKLNTLEPDIVTFLSQDVRNTELSSRTINGLLKCKCRTLLEASNLVISDYLHCRGVGKVSARELVKYLCENGISDCTLVNTAKYADL